MQQLQLHSQSKLATLAPLFLVLIIDAMGIGLVLPLLGPMFISHTSAFVSTNMSTGMRDLLYGTTLAMFCFFMFFGAPFLGDLSDHLGRKRVLLICLFGTAVGLVISAIGVDIKSVFLLIAGRGVTGFMCGSQALAQAAIVDISDDTNKTINLSLISLASCIGFVLGPIMSGLLTGPSLLQKYGLASPFWVGAVLALLNGVVLVFTFRETFFPKAVQRLHLTKGIKVFIAAFTNKSVRRLAIIYLVAELGFSLYFQLIPIYLVNAYGATSVQISHVMAFMGAIFAASLLWLIRIVTKYMSATKITFYFLILTGLGVLLLLSRHYWVVWLSVVPAAIGGALFYVSLLTLFSDAVDKDSQGWVMGVFAAVAAASWFVSGFLSGLLAVYGLWVPVTLAGGALIVSALPLLPRLRAE